MEERPQMRLGQANRRRGQPPLRRGFRPRRSQGWGWCDQKLWRDLEAGSEGWSRCDNMATGAVFGAGFVEQRWVHLRFSGYYLRRGQINSGANLPNLVNRSTNEGQWRNGCKSGLHRQIDAGGNLLDKGGFDCDSCRDRVCVTRNFEGTWRRGVKDGPGVTTWRRGWFLVWVLWSNDGFTSGSVIFISEEDDHIEDTAPGNTPCCPFRSGDSWDKEGLCHRSAKLKNTFIVINNRPRINI